MRGCGTCYPELVSDQARHEIERFGRFLREAPPPGTPGRFWRQAPGWIPYILGVGPEPPEGMGHVPMTAWTMPA